MDHGGESVQNASSNFTLWHRSSIISTILGEVILPFYTSLVAMTRFEHHEAPSRRFRVAMVCDFFFPRLGGVETHIYSLSQHLLRLGHKVIIISHAYGDRKGVRYLPGPLKVYYCPILPMTDQDALPTFTATLPLMRSILLRERIDIVHAHQATSTMASESIFYASALKIASVYTDHSLFGFDDLASVLLNRVLQTTLSTVDAAICVSHVCRDNLILRAHLDPPRVRVIPNAVDPSKFTPDPSKRSKDRYVHFSSSGWLWVFFAKLCAHWSCSPTLWNLSVLQ
jgi:glycosyltransferase involved in cell wall biosynthesis